MGEASIAAVLSVLVVAVTYFFNQLRDREKAERQFQAELREASRRFDEERRASDRQLVEEQRRFKIDVYSELLVAMATYEGITKAWNKAMLMAGRPVLLAFYAIVDETNLEREPSMDRLSDLIREMRRDVDRDTGAELDDVTLKLIGSVPWRSQ